MFYIILLILLGLLFLVAEIVLLPGVSVGALLALVCDGSAIYLAFRYHDTPTGIAVVALVVVLSLVVTVLSLRAKTWQRFSLRQKIDSSSMPSPQTRVRTGERGVTVSRLSPMGRVEIGGELYEAKSLDAYVDPRTEVEVVGFENFSVIVKPVENQSPIPPTDHGFAIGHHRPYRICLAAGRLAGLLLHSRGAVVLGTGVGGPYQPAPADSDALAQGAPLDHRLLDD